MRRYIEETIQKTGVAMETSGFTFVTSGKKRDTMTGKATLKLFPHFKELADVAGARRSANALRLYQEMMVTMALTVHSGNVECITTEVCLSKAKRFPVVTFVDTPGLVDGTMQYPFDVDKSIIWLSACLCTCEPPSNRCDAGKLADLVFVFFDPMGQALCKHTLDVIGA